MIKKFLIKDTMLMVIIAGLVLMVSIAINDIQKEPFSGVHFNYMMIGFYLCWVAGYNIIQKYKKLTDDVVKDFGETVPIMCDMLGKIKEQHDIIKELQEQLDSK